jgi:predicted DNA-binding transcriptional regulator AlpA
MDVFVLEWDRLMRVATLADDLDTAQREYLEDLTTASGPLRLVGVTGVALICGVRKAQAGVVARSEGFPAPAALLRRSHIWYRDEVEAYHQGKEVRRRESSLQAQILDSAEVCKRLNVAIGTLTAGIHARKPWAPQPTGAVSTSLYWLRDDFEAWFRTRTKVRKRDAKRTAKGV